MPHTRYAAFLLVLALLTWFGDKGRPVGPPDKDRLQGTWEITSVYRDGVPDPTQVGGYVTFEGDTVVFPPRNGGIEPAAAPAVDPNLAAFS